MDEREAEMSVIADDTAGKPVSALTPPPSGVADPAG